MRITLPYANLLKKFEINLTTKGSLSKVLLAFYIHIMQSGAEFKSCYTCLYSLDISTSCINRWIVYK